MAKRTLYPLFAAQDEPVVRPILDALKQNGFAVDQGHAPKKNGAVLFFLSKNLTEASPEIDEFLRLDAQKCDVIPVNLDGSAPPTLIENAIMARNAIFAERYTTDALADRIADALKGPAPAAKLRKWIIAAAAVVLLAVVGVVLWRVLANKGAKGTGADATPAPTAAPTPVPDMPDDIPPEDITKIIEISFVGDTYQWYTTDDQSYRDSTFNRGYSEFSYRYWADDGAHWFSKEDGHEFPMTHYDDLSWLASLPNLRYVTFCAVEAEVPSLKDLRNLVGVFYCDNRIGTLEWLRGSTLHFIEYHGGDVTDFSPLSDCKNFNSAHLDLVDSRTVDFSGFCPRSLRMMRIENGYDLQTVDLSALNRCANLEELHISNIPVADDFSLSGCKKLRWIEAVGLPLRNLSFLSECTSLTELRIEDMDIGTLNGVEKLSKLQTLWTENTKYRDISAIGGCTSLEIFFMGGADWWNTPYSERLHDLTPLCSLPKLREIALHGADVTNLDFLNDLRNKEGISLHFSSSAITDFSGLAAIRSFSFLHCNLSNRDFSALVLPYIQDAVFIDLSLYRCRNVDLSALPEVRNSLTIDYGDLTDLKGLDQPILRLELNNCQYLTSLNGMHDLKNFGNGNGTLYVEGCPRLVDWSALDGLRLSRLEFCGTYSLPDFSGTNARFLKFDYVDEDVLPDLSCLNGLDRSQRYDFDFAEQQNLPDLLPLFELKGGHLVVPPQLSEQAQELVETGRFDSFEVRYPEGNWEPDREAFTLLSLDELETLPKTVLKKVERLYMAGDTVFDPDQYWVDEDWDVQPMQAYLCAHGTGREEGVPVETGTKLTDLSVLKDLTGLRCLYLYMQPLETLDGIQYLESLEELNVEECFAMTDVSAAFTLQSLTELNLRDLPEMSIEGVQNLYGLRYLWLHGTDVKDLSPLAGLDESVTVAGVKLPLMTFEEFCALPQAVLNNLDRIEFAGNYVFDPYSNWWIEEDRDRYYLHDDGNNSRTLLEPGPLTDFNALPVMQRLSRLRINVQPITSFEGLERQPNLRYFEMRRCFEIDDITPLFEFENLSCICVAYTNVDSIEGVQKMKRLTELNLSPSRITDLSPLAEIDYTYCMQADDDGSTPYFELQVDWMQDQLAPEQYAYLACVPYYNFLNINGTDWKLWTETLKDTKIREVSAQDCGWTNEAFAAFVAQHPELEQLDLRWNPQLTDLSPLLSLQNFRQVEVSRNMNAAMRSLGDGFGFALNIEN